MFYEFRRENVDIAESFFRMLFASILTTTTPRQQQQKRAHGGRAGKLGEPPLRRRLAERYARALQEEREEGEGDEERGATFADWLDAKDRHAAPPGASRGRLTSRRRRRGDDGGATSAGPGIWFHSAGHCFGRRVADLARRSSDRIDQICRPERGDHISR